jgi:uncharacterized protein YjiS (DUF1127 family)
LADFTRYRDRTILRLEKLFQAAGLDDDEIRARLERVTGRSIIHTMNIGDNSRQWREKTRRRQALGLMDKNPSEKIIPPDQVIFGVIPGRCTRG